MPMKCPVCKDVTLLMAEKHDVEIDYCPECRGIWLDRGELDKIIERASKYDDRDDRDEKSRNREKPKKKSAFLGDILEIFGGD